MEYVLDHRGKPYRKFFENIAHIPHESFNEKALSDYIVEFAKERGLWSRQDEVWNVIVKKPASLGYEDHSPVMIQGHIDMVCVKTPDSDHNFDVDPLELYVEDGFLKAKNTTLGADCGHGISYMLAILDDKELKHPPLECLFTVQEEVGIGGPKYIDYSLLSAKRMIATDSMKEGSPEVSTTSVLGGAFIKKAVREPVNEESFYRITVGGLTGGHAAVDINKGRANAIKLLIRAAYSISEKTGVRIAEMSGGTLKNNIPNKAEMIVCIKEKNACKDIENIIAGLNEDVKFEYRKSDKNVYIKVEQAQSRRLALTADVSREIINWMMQIPTGTYMASPEDPAFPWSSRNLGVVKLEADKLHIEYMFRSSLKSHIKMLFDEQAVLCGMFGAVWEEEYRYPGYVVEPDTHMYKVYEAVYKEKTGRELAPVHIHAGTDVGTIMENMGGLDVVGIGPNTYKFHTPDECLDLESYDRVYGYITSVLERL